MIQIPSLKLCKVQGCCKVAVAYDGKCQGHTRASRERKEYSHRPRLPKRHAFAVELEVECDGKPGAIVHRHSCSDGSLSDGVEYKIVAPIGQVAKSAMDVAQRARLLGCKAEKSCGFHVHMCAPGPIGSRWADQCGGEYNVEVPRLEQELSLVDGVPTIRDVLGEGSVRLYPWKTLGYWIARNEDFFFDLMPKHRRDNQYCRRLKGNPDAMQDHYAWMSLSRHGTLECRLHPGTTNPFKVGGWLAVMRDLHKFLSGLVTTSIRQDGYHAECTPLTKAHDIPWSPVAKAYLDARHAAGGSLSAYGFAS